MAQKQTTQMIKAIRKAIAYYGESNVAFTDALGIHNSVLYHWFSGRSVISLRTACKIEKLVDGHVTIYDLIPSLSEDIRKGRKA